MLDDTTNTEQRRVAADCPNERFVRAHAFLAPRGYAEPDHPYRSRFGFVWWFWLPRIHAQRYEVLNGYANPAVVRMIWLCFAIGLDIGREGTTEP